MMSFNIHLASYPGVAIDVNRDLVMWGKIQDDEAFNVIVNRLLIVEQLYPYYLNEISNTLDSNLNFLLQFKILNIPHSEVNQNNDDLSGEIYKWNLQSSLDYLKNNENIRVEIFIFYCSHFIRFCDLSLIAIKSLQSLDFTHICGNVLTVKQSTYYIVL